MPNMGQHLRDVESARDAVDKPAVAHALSTTKKEQLKGFLLSDSYAFTYIVCGHRDMVHEVHMPLSYAACGLADKLAWSITQSGFEGYVIDQFRDACRTRYIDPAEAEGVTKLDVALDWVNQRWTRGAFKSSVVTHGGITFTATVDPNTTNKITTAVDEKAWELCDQVGDTILSGRYRDLFPERVPQGNLKELVTSKRITLGGRTISHPQTTIQAWGYRTKDIGGHYDRFWCDDLVVGGEGGNNTPTLLPGVHSWLTGMPGFFMHTRRVRVVHAGTRWDDNDDHRWLSTGKRALACFSIVVPIETYEGEVVNILERGTPTMPTFLPKEKIQALQDRTLGDESEAEGAQSWRCNNLLDPGIGGGRLFADRIINDPDRAWMGPFQHPKARIPKFAKQFESRFIVARFARDEEGRVVDKDKHPLIEQYQDASGVTRTRLVADWRKRAHILRFDPWADLDRVLTVDPAWKDGGNNWAVTASGVDPWMVKFQLETQSDTDGLDGWVEALAEMDEIYRPRVIGFGAGGYQDPMVQNLLRTDKRLRKLRGRIIPLSENEGSKWSRIKGGVAEALKMYRLMLLPPSTSEDGDYGAAMTRAEMQKLKKGDKNAKDGILDTLWMVDAVARRVRTQEDREQAKKDLLRRQSERRLMIDPVLGVPLEGLRDVA